MTPKEKAEELVGKFIPHTRVFHEVLGWENYEDSAKQCAVIAVDEIIEALDFDWMEVQNLDREYAYWNKVKQEIDKL